MASSNRGARAALTLEVGQNRKSLQEKSSAAISAFINNIDWHVDINILLSSNKVSAGVSQFIHVLGARRLFVCLFIEGLKP